MERKQAYEQVLKILKPFVKNEKALASLSEKTRILEDLQVNSARLVDIILAIEDEFGIEVEDEAADRVTTLGDAVELILTKTAQDGIDP